MKTTHSSNFMSRFAATAAAVCLTTAMAVAADPTTQPQQQSQESSPAETRTGNGNGNGYRQNYRRNRDYGNRDSNTTNSNNGSNRTRDNNSTGESYTDKYAILAEQNIFLRDRSRPNRSGPTSQGAPATPEQLLTLTGVVFEDGQYRAYLEDLRSGRVQRLSEGDSVARGRISQIDIDAIEYETGSGSLSNNSQRTWVEVGSDLTGKAATPTTVGGEADSGPKLDPNDPNLTPEQRLKARRQALMGR
jgi:hypothetical protein